jgi:hypothetical protein
VPIGQEGAAMSDFKFEISAVPRKFERFAITA